MSRMDRFDDIRDYLSGLQDRICAAIETADGRARFVEDAWQRDPADASTHLRGGGRTRILQGCSPGRLRAESGAAGLLAS